MTDIRAVRMLEERDAEIERLRAEVERLRAVNAELVAQITREQQAWANARNRDAELVAALTDMVSYCKPARDEWLNDKAFKEFQAVYERAAALTGKDDAALTWSGVVLSAPDTSPSFLRQRSPEDEPFQCPEPLTCQFPRCDCGRQEGRMAMPIVKPPTREQMQQQITWLEAEVERLRADLATHVAATEETENSIIDAEFEATRLRAANAELVAVLRWVSERRWDEDADLDDICTRADQAVIRYLDAALATGGKE